ncbi:uncharacterized protein N7506_001352 [Penicillium brevicompactum]|uniref:uncharacterized protein n=1 Tax=Penicillium brevicompactum TaxID=5074 RepID=UPI002540DAAC|nr:uncharacterized protein N7506_001352 [Penicillium brevicompactum]KAJ5348099.1 hypothetical protein N7506_001352 [Penicillium brevicompactum]
MAPLDDVQVGDVVNVPGGMYGTIKYLGSVAGKPGRFAGVELSSEHAQRGKNNGDVDGRKYFATSVPGSGIFVPMNNSKYVTRRSTSNISNPVTPARGGPVNFSKSVGPALTTPRPRVRRPSLPRPESPRVPPPKLSLSGLRTPSAASRSGLTSAQRSPVKAPSRLSDRPSSRMSTADDDSSYGRPSDFRRPSSSGNQDLKDQIKSLEKQLLDRDRQLEEQSGTLNEFQRTLEEMEGSEGISIRTQLRERNERINQLTAEFDGHRADFRSTLDTLEVAASETERVYEQRLDELMQQNKELQDRGEDVEVVAQQLKQLEELVSELEEGLEDARRGEAEARAEVEFLRGEVERTKLELKKERDYSAAALKDVHGNGDAPRSSSDLDQKDDEIRGLKAIIHSLSRGNPAEDEEHHGMEGHDPEQLVQLELRMREIEETVDYKDSRIEELERELQEMHLQGGRQRSSTVTLSPKQHKPTHSAGNISNHSNNNNNNNNNNNPHRLSDRTVVPPDWHDAPTEPRHHRGASNTSQSRLETMHESEQASDEDALWCEICEASGHDILNCTSMFGSGQNVEHKPTEEPAEEPEEPIEKTEPLRPKEHEEPQKTGKDVVMEGLKGIGGLGSSMAPVAGKSSGVIDESKWCAMCERDGHESIDCPFDE